MNPTVYTILYGICRFFLFLWHPVFRVTGRENIPADTHVVLCANHRGMADPFWILFALKSSGGCPRIMAKDAVMRIPLLGRLLKTAGVFGVRRGENDITAVKEGLSCLKGGRSLLLFPEGTRVKPGQTVEAKSGALLLSMRTSTPILPIYLETRRFPFSPMRCVIGKAYLPEAENLRRPTPEELHRGSRELMDKIYALGETK